MSRKPDPLTQYRMRVHEFRGYRYASTQPTVSNPLTGKRYSKRIHWGVLEAGNRFIPNRNFRRMPLEEQKKFLFPEEWDLSEVAELSSKAEDTLYAERRILHPKMIADAIELPHRIPTYAH